MRFIDPNIEAYAVSKSSVPGDTCRDLEDYTRENIEMSQMLTGPMEASFLGLLIHMLQAQRVLEIGTYTGYSALSMAEHLPADGELITLDIDPATARIARDFWDRSEHGKKITQRIGAALESLENLEGSFDLVFIDADKQNYLNYFKAALKRLSARGVIVIDNVLWSGKVLEKNGDEATRAIQELNDYVKAQDNLHVTLLPIRDGILVVKPLR